MLRILGNLLRQLGFINVSEAEDGEDAFRELKRDKYNLVISDCNMQRMSGLDLLRKVRGDQELGHLPFIMVTAESKTETVIAAKNAGVSNYIVKPFNAETLKKKWLPCWVPFEEHDVTSATQDRADDAADRARDSLGLQKPHAVYQKFACELLAAWRSGNDEAGRTLLCELGHLSSHIRNVRDEIASMSLSELQDHCIPTASDQLEEVVKMTEQATTRIMDIAESLEAAVDEDEPNLQEKLRQATTAIYEACNFQDITGQRVRKVVRALQTIESRIDALLWALSGDGGDGRQQRATHGSDGCAANVPGDLLEGPQLPGKGNSQADVDALFDL